MVIARKAERFANSLLEMPMGENDLEIAAVLKELAKVYEAAFDMVYADTHEQSKQAYLDMFKLVKGG
jgi:hypothetical protein